MDNLSVVKEQLDHLQLQTEQLQDLAMSCTCHPTCTCYAHDDASLLSTQGVQTLELELKAAGTVFHAT